MRINQVFKCNGTVCPEKVYPLKSSASVSYSNLNALTPKWPRNA